MHPYLFPAKRVFREPSSAFAAGIERLYGDVPRIELFARGKKEGLGLSGRWGGHVSVENVADWIAETDGATSISRTAIA